MKSMLNVRLAEKRMTKTQLMRDTGMSKDVLWRMTRDDAIGNVALWRLVRVADALGCEVTDLFEE